MSRHEHHGFAIAVTNILPAIDSVGGIENDLNGGFERVVWPEQGEAKCPQCLINEASRRAQYSRPGRVARYALPPAVEIIRHSCPPRSPPPVFVQGSYRSMP